MPNFNLKQQPQYPIKVIDTNSPISLEQLNNAFDGLDAITLCVRSKNGHPNRGGHFFCIRNSQHSEEMHLETIEGDDIDMFTPEQLIRFINHASGLLFDREMLTYCQNSINFRTD